MNRQKGDIVYDLFILALIMVFIAQTCKASSHQDTHEPQTQDTK